MAKCCCHLIKNQKINSAAQFERMKSLFANNDYKSLPYYSFSYLERKRYKCKVCGRVWSFVYPDFPSLGEIRLVRLKIRMNKYMRELLSSYQVDSWYFEAKYCKQSKIIYEGIPKDINDVIAHYWDEEWIDKPIECLNNYTSLELSKSIKGRMILKMYMIHLIKGIRK